MPTLPTTIGIFAKFFHPKKINSEGPSMGTRNKVNLNLIPPFSQKYEYTPFHNCN